MSRYITRHEELRTIVIWDGAANAAVCDSGGPLVWSYSDLKFVEWFASQLNELKTVEEIRASL